MSERDELERVIAHLAAMERPSASPGERDAAEWIAGELRERGVRTRIEEELAHGGYWWPLGLLSGLGVLAALAGVRGHRRLGAALGLLGAAGVWDDVSGGRLWFRRLLPRRTTHNVTAEAGDPEAERTLVVVAHHDAAHSGLIFHPGVLPLVDRIAPGYLQRAETSPAVMAPVVAGPALAGLAAALGARRLSKLGACVSVGTAAAMADIGLRDTVPGANDNATAVAVLLALAHRWEERPLGGLRVLLVSTGSEESFMEGMQGWAKRHFAGLDPDTTRFVAIDTLGSPNLALIEGEGMLRMRDYDPGFRELAERCARERGVRLRRGLRLRNATDGLLPLKAGYDAIAIGSVNELKAPANYHWPTDTAENVDLDTVAGAVELLDGIARAVAA